MRRTKNIANASLANLNRYRQALHGGFPREKSVILLNGKSVTIPLKNPMYHSKRQYIVDEKDNRPFVEIIPEFVDWLVTFSLSFLINTADEKVAFLDAKRDFLNPGPSAFRVYEEDYKENGTFVQIQVAKIPGFSTWYQLDYYEFINYDKANKIFTSNNAVHKSTILCDVAKPNFCFVDTVYNNRNTKYSPEILANIFRSVLIYMRPLDYESTSKNLVITPMTPYSHNDFKIPKLPQD